MTTSRVAGESMEQTTEYLKGRIKGLERRVVHFQAKHGEMKAERDYFRGAFKGMSEQCTKLREALINLLHAAPPTSRIEKPLTPYELAVQRARDALAGGSEGETPCTHDTLEYVRHAWRCQQCGKAILPGDTERCDCYPSPENWGVCRDCGKDILDSGTES